MSSYAELHCHSTFSLLDGASDPERLVERAVAVGLGALALTDHDDVGGAVRFATAAREAKLAGIHGAELTVDVPAPRSPSPRAAAEWTEELILREATAA